MTLDTLVRKALLPVAFVAATFAGCTAKRAGRFEQTRFDTARYHALETAVKESPSTKSPFFTHVDAARVTVHREGDFPLIYIPWVHPAHHALSNENDDLGKCVARIWSMTDALHDKGYRGIVIEGISAFAAEEYAKDKKILFAHPSGKATPFYGTLSELVNAKEWTLGAAECDDSMVPVLIHGINTKTAQNIALRCDSWHAKGFIDDAATWARNSEACRKEYLDAVQQYLKDVQAYYATDPRGENIYTVVLTKRNASYVAEAKRLREKGAKGVVIIAGAGHREDMLEQLAQSGLPYAEIVPKDVPFLDRTKEVRLGAVRKEFFVLDNGIRVRGRNNDSVILQVDISQTRAYRECVLGEKLPQDYKAPELLCTSTFHPR